MSKAAKTPIIMTISVLLPIIAIAFVTFRDYRPEPDRLNLRIPDEQLRLGELWPVKKHECSLTIENESNRDIVIRRFKTSCVCSSVEPQSLTIPASESRTINVTLDLTAFAVGQSEDWVKPFSVSIHPILEELGAASNAWNLSGEIVLPVIDLPASIDFGELDTGDSVDDETSHVIVLRKNSKLNALEFESSPPVQLDYDPDYGEAEARLTIGLDTITESGDLLSEITVRAIGPDDKPFGDPLTTKVLARVRSSLFLSPDPVNLGAVARGESVSETITFRSRFFDRKPRLVNSEVDKEWIKVKPLDAEDQFEITVTPTETGQAGANVKLTFEWSNPDGKEVVTLPVRYFGKSSNKEN